jgi:hypothetical protein
MVQVEAEAVGLLRYLCRAQNGEREIAIALQARPSPARNMTICARMRLDHTAAVATPPHQLQQSVRS